MCRRQKPCLNGDSLPAEGGFLSPLRGSDIPYAKPTADAAGYRLTLLRSDLPLLSKLICARARFSSPKGCADSEFLTYC